MRHRLSAAVLALAFGAATLPAQLDAQQGPPKPAPETKKLDAFAGKWQGEGEMKPGPWGPGGKMTNVDDCSWFDGGFQLVCHSSGSGAMGSVKGEGVMSWSPEDKVYKYMGYDSMGMSMSATGTNTGNTWNWKSTDKMGGKTIHSRYTVTLTSPTTQVYKYETSEDGKTWNTMAEGKSSKK
jgi:hypothetical protein